MNMWEYSVNFDTIPNLRFTSQFESNSNSYSNKNRVEKDNKNLSSGKICKILKCSHFLCVNY